MEVWIGISLISMVHVRASQVWLLESSSTKQYFFLKGLRFLWIFWNNLQECCIWPINNTWISCRTAKEPSLSMVFMDQRSPVAVCYPHQCTQCCSNPHFGRLSLCSLPDTVSNDVECPGNVCSESLQETCIYIICMCIYIYMYLYICICVYMYMCIYVYAYMYIDI